jgi:hypothetical protein
MALTDDEKQQLERLTAKEKEPANGSSERVTYHIDFSDPDAIRRAVRAGKLPESMLDDADKLDDKDDDTDDGKKKRGKDDPDDAPRRRLRGADKWAGES